MWWGGDSGRAGFQLHGRQEGAGSPIRFQPEGAGAVAADPGLVGLLSSQLSGWDGARTVWRW